MKKITILALACTCFMACSKNTPNDPELPKKEITEEKKEKEEKKEDTPNDPPTPPQTVSVTREDIAAYYAFDTTLPVYTALEKIKTTQGERTVNQKKVTVGQAEVKDSSEEKGSFTLSVTGKVGTSEFKQEFTFDGFLKKPETFHMANRAQVNWKKDINRYAELDFYQLIVKKNTAEFTAEKLSRIFDFYASSTDGQPYPFGPNDLKQTKLSDWSYSNGQLSVKFSYGSTTASKPLTLEFKSNEYYAHQVSLVAEFGKDKYMRGVAEYPQVFDGQAISYDVSRYAVKSTKVTHIDNSDNSFDLELQLTENDGQGDILATFTKRISGFKPLKDLKKEMTAASTGSLITKMQTYIKANTPNGDITKYLTDRIDIKAWINLVEFSITTTQNHDPLTIIWDNKTLIERSGTAKDLRLENPIFELSTAKLDGDQWPKTLHLTIKLVEANSVYLGNDDVTMKFSVSVPLKSK